MLWKALKARQEPLDTEVRLWTKLRMSPWEGARHCARVRILHGVHSARVLTAVENPPKFIERPVQSC
jgi:hypothetical protein